MKKFIAAYLLLCATALFSQDIPADRDGDGNIEKPVEKKKKRNGEIVVTATKSEINKKETGASITIITGEEIEQRGRRNVADIIEDTAGISVSKSSEFGGKTSAFIRGTNSGSLVVLIDGVKVNDPSLPNRGFDWGFLSADNIERIEIIRGSQSTLYGSDAIGGVINIITKKGGGAPKLTIKGEAGSYSTYKELISVNGGDEIVSYFFGVSRTDSSGFSKASSASGNNSNLERDPYHNTSASTRISAKTVNNSELFFSMRYINSDASIDGGAYTDDANHSNLTQMLSAQVGYMYPFFKWWDASLIYSHMNVTREDVKSTQTWYKGKDEKGEFKNRFNIEGVDEIITGFEFEKESALSSGGVDRARQSKSGYAQNHLKLFNRIFFISGVRYSDPENYDARMTYNLSSSIIIPVTETRIKGNYATGYKAPTFDQLYSVWGGNDKLKPEKSKSFDIGFEQPLLNEKIVFEVNHFEIDYTDMIISDSSWTNQNIGKAEIRGYEFILKLKPINDLKVDASYTITETKDFSTDKEFILRPKYRAGVNVNYSFLGVGNVNLGFVYVGKRLDYLPMSSDVSYLAPYYTFNLAASYWVIPELQVFGRIENLMNRKYEDVRGYQTPLRSYYAGAKAVF